MSCRTFLLPGGEERVKDGFWEDMGCEERFAAGGKKMPGRQEVERVSGFGDRNMRR